MTERELILQLRPPAKVYVGSSVRNDLRMLMDGIPVFGSFAPWPASPDLLFHSGTRVLVGVTYAVPDDLRDDVKSLCEVLDSRVVRYNDFAGGSRVESYGVNPDGPHHLEILWGPAYADSFALAQLSSDTWYYSADRSVVGFELDYLDSVLEDYKLALPERFSLPELALQRIVGDE